MATTAPKKTLLPPPPPSTPVMGPGMPDIIAQALFGPQGGYSGFPSTPFMNAAAGQVAPEPAMRPVLPELNLPAFPQLNQSYLDPEAYKQLEQGANAENQLATNAKDRFAKIDQETLADPTMPQSPFEEMMAKGLQEHMLKLMSGADENSVSSRFGKGFDLGQKIGANILTPLMGVMSNSPGGAIGAAQATQNMQQQIAQQKQQKNADAAARNSMIASMAQMYETMSPQSAKNLIALATKKMETHKYNQGVKDSAYKDVLTATHNAYQAQKDLLGVKSTAVEKQDASKLGQFNAQVGAAVAGQTGAARVQASADKGTELVNQASQIKLHGDSIDQHKEAAANANTQAIAMNKLKATEQVALRMKQLREDMDAMNSQNQPKYPNALKNFMTNKAELESLGLLMKTAGMTQTPEDLVAAFSAPNEAAPAQQGGFDIMQALGNAGKQIFGGPQQPKFDLSAIPTEDLAKHAKVKKVNGVWQAVK